MTVHPHRIWEAFAAHVEVCSSCRQAGGTRADTASLCPRGRALVTAWEHADLDWVALRRMHGLPLPAGVSRAL